MKVNFKNLAENLIIVLVCVSVGGYVGYTASLSANKQSIELLTPTITEAIKRETTSIKNEITHDISVKVDKIKKSDSININVIQTPNTSQKPDNTIKQSQVLKGCEEGYICVKIENLTRRQKRRLIK